MDVKAYYTDRFENKYNLHIRLWSAFKGFFGFNNPYQDAIKDIAQKSVKDALVSDLYSIRQDSHKVLAEKNLKKVAIAEEECALQ